MIGKIQKIDTLLRVYNFEVSENHNYFVSNLGILVHNDCNFKLYRGGSSMKPRKGVDYKVDADGFVNEKGISINTDKLDPNIDKYGGAWEVDLSSIPSGLKIKHTKGTHYEIVPARDMKEAEFLELMSKVAVKRSNTIK
ncbi:hypothetical protein [Fluviicola sp.]|uniref:hypothetical protein n=1 Tax=Fluviicola sp. TaxID=1917219 RepID=UPI003D2D2177